MFAGKLEQSSKLFGDMVKKGYIPDEATYNVLISGYGKVGKLREACDLVGQMEEAQLVPNAFTYRALVYSLCKVKDFESVLEIFDVMLSRGFDVGLNDYNAHFPNT